MTSCRSAYHSLAFRTLFRWPLFLVVVTLTGCEDKYNVDIRYPARTDWIVEKPATLQPTRFNPPGVLPLHVLDNPDATFFGPDRDLLIQELNEKKTIVDPRKVEKDVQELVTRAVREVAGRPRNPKIDFNGTKYDELNHSLVNKLLLDRKTLSDGSKLYRRHCLHCHGVSGDGKGPTGAWVNPPPRDYRQGIFKFASSGQPQGQRKPRREDLKRVLLNGIEGTSMPSFHLLKPEEVEAIVSYVIHLSMRGQIEYVALLDIARGTASADAPIYEQVREIGERIAQEWLAAHDAEMKPQKIPEFRTEEERIESAARGFRIFSNKDQGGCVQCHVNIGRDAPYYYDAWGTIVRPRNLYSGQVRGGSRPIDLYWRLRGGIDGSGMPAVVANDAELAQKEPWLWDLVNFIQLAPYRDKRKAIANKLEDMQKDLKPEQRVRLPVD